MSKLEHYVIENNKLQWFISYMHNRQQYVEIENIKSTTETITTGVPQGSILGQLLFLIYINDLALASKQFSPIMYADDTTLLSKLQNSTSNHSSNSTSYNFNAEKPVNRLSPNSKKTKMMIFHSKQNKLSVNEIPIIKINDMPSSPHCNDIANKLSRICGVVSGLKHSVRTYSVYLNNIVTLCSYPT